MGDIIQPRSLPERTGEFPDVMAKLIIDRSVPSRVTEFFGAAMIAALNGGRGRCRMSDSLLAGITCSNKSGG